MKYPWYIKLMKMIDFQFALLSRIHSIVTSPDKEICVKNKVLLIKMALTPMEERLLEIEEEVLKEEFTHSRAEVLNCQENMTALTLRFTLFLN